MRFWIGLSLLSGSWLFCLDYFVQANPALGTACIALGALLVGLSQVPARTAADPAPGTRRPLLSMMLAPAFLPAVVLLPFPQRLGPLLLIAGALLELPRSTSRWLRAASSGAILTGLILLAQSLALAAYKHFTARSHELPWPLPQLLAGVARSLGANAAADGSELVLSTMRHNHRLAATWELFLDPATACFIAGALAALGCSSLVMRQKTAGAGVEERGSEGTGGERTSAASLPLLPHPPLPATGSVRRCKPPASC